MSTSHSLGSEGIDLDNQDTVVRLYLRSRDRALFAPSIAWVRHSDASDARQPISAMRTGYANMNDISQRRADTVPYGVLLNRPW